MNNLRLSTLSLTLAIAVILLGYVNSSFAAPPNKPCSPWPSCNKDEPPDPTPTITYTAELTGRVFNFAQVTVTPDSEDGPLFPDPSAILTFTRPADADPNAQAVWDAVFAACENFFAPPVVESFEVPAGNWSIHKPGGVRVILSPVPFDIYGKSPPGESGQHFHVSLQLIGDTFFKKSVVPFLPVPVDSDPVEVEYHMIESWITGGTEKGVRPKTGCVSGGSADRTIFGGSFESTLVITAN